jgi:precorrin-6B methylase 2
MSGRVVSRLREAPPTLHADGTAFWGTGWGALVWLEESLRPGMATLETGAGATTIVFAASGAHHEAITPAETEVERIRHECARLGISLDRVEFRLGPSEEVLPGLAPEPLDVVLVGGADGFPYPILDWWYLAPRLRLGGYLLVDAAYNPAAGALVEHLRADDAWRMRGVLGYRTVLVEKVSEAPPRPLFAGERAIGRLSFRYLPPRRRLSASSRHAIFTTRPGLAAVGWARRHAGWLWRERG